MSSDLDQLERRELIWRPGQRRVLAKKGLPTGLAELDTALRDGGWPRGALIELLVDKTGAAELHVLLPALSALSARGFSQLWIRPPHLPFAPQLTAMGLDLNRTVFVHPHSHQEWLWATEQALRSPGCAAVVSWSAGRSTGRYAELRKIQVAAAERNSIGFIIGSSRNVEASSPAAVRLLIERRQDQLQITLIKQRGASGGQRICLDLPFSLRKQLPLRERPAITSQLRPPSAPIAALVRPALRLDVGQ